MAPPTHPLTSFLSDAPDACHDSTQIAELLAGQNRLLAALAQGQTVEKTLWELCALIDEHIEGVKTELSDWSYTPETHLFGRVSSFGRTRHGKRLAVWPEKYTDRDRYPLLTIVGPDPMDTNDKAVRWIAERMKIRLES